MEKVFLAIMVGRQIMGDYVFVRVMKAANTAAKIDEYTGKLRADFVGSDGKPKAIRIETPNGDADCICELGTFEVDVDQ